jgi:hypothetical protein
MVTIHLPHDFKEFLTLLNVYLEVNKKASSRHQDLADLEKLP